ncbi:copper homeostasis membrane protein CopD [Sphingopyxis panaciterrae]
MTDTLMIGIRFLLFADLMLVMGLAMFLLYALRRADREDVRIVSGLAAPQPWLGGVGLLASLGGMLALAASMQGVAVGEVDPDMLVSMAVETDTGKAWIVRMLALVVATVAAMQLGRRPRPAALILSLASASALASLVWSGHAAASEGPAGTIHRIADALHMVAASIWIGAIAAFLILLRPASDGRRQARLNLAARSLDQFARVGTVCVLVIVATGVINFEVLVGIARTGRMLGSSYGYLLIAKLVAFGAMLVSAASNRWRLVPAFAGEKSEKTAAAIRHSLVLEASAAAVILGLVASLGMLDPDCSGRSVCR